ncbi:hypothetical protein EPA93_47390 [Ktedonosporobacter rubrisoli]|uniref:Uncharacterized protein n=1 Tax=Ktedonosporobacter rubrisoli TaxID=2509675 RepID=A0A4P6K4Q0_KTERU|nr:DUF6391 domain-containing protein [Ktedonosporobacter rubrisoli]QBD83184.1 hypothetical protein EPA93_47390 [Ktedonosporobacter rubrisoli]
MSSINPLVQVAQQMLLGGAVKQNHALEHATIVLLSKKFPDVRLSGISFAAGFFVFGDVPTEAILPTAQEALQLLRTTHPDLAVHERCGTNLAVAGMLTGLSAMAVAKMRRPYSTANNVILASTAALVLSRPLGLLVQRYVTTQTPNSSMQILKVTPRSVLGAPAHFVSTDNPDAAGLFS